MSMHFNLQNKGPFVHRFIGDVDKDWIYPSFPGKSLKVFVVSGKLIETVNDFFSEIASAFEFPEYFGGNTDAFLDCILDLDWLEADGYIVICEWSENLLSSERHEIHWLVNLLQTVGTSWSEPVNDGEAWDRPAKPFHTIFSLHSNEHLTQFALDSVEEIQVVG